MPNYRGFGLDGGVIHVDGGGFGREGGSILHGLYYQNFG